jgi:hypothetical protein
MFDYLERTSLKFHIEEFLQNNIQLPYRIKNFHIQLSQNDRLLHVHISDLELLAQNCPRPFSDPNHPQYLRTISFHIKDLNFEHLLNNVNHTLTEFEQTRKQKNK